MCFFLFLSLFYSLTVFMFGIIIIEDTNILYVYAHADMVICVCICEGQNLILCPALYSLPYFLRLNLLTEPVVQSLG